MEIGIYEDGKGRQWVSDRGMFLWSELSSHLRFWPAFIFSLQATSDILIQCLRTLSGSFLLKSLPFPPARPWYFHLLSTPLNLLSSHIY